MVILNYSYACLQWKNKTNGTKEILKPGVLGRKGVLRNLRFQPSHVLKSPSLFMSASSMIATPLCCIGTPGEVPWRQGSTRLEPQFLKGESMRGFLLQKSKI